MRAIGDTAYDQRVEHYVRKGRRQVTMVMLVAIVCIGAFGLGIAQVATANGPGGGRTGFGTMPKTTLAWPSFRASLEQLVRRPVGVVLYQNCNRNTCAVYSYYARYTATFQRIRGVWHIRTATVPVATIAKLAAPKVTTS